MSSDSETEAMKQEEGPKDPEFSEGTVYSVSHDTKPIGTLEVFE